MHTVGLFSTIWSELGDFGEAHIVFKNADGKLKLVGELLPFLTIFLEKASKTLQDSLFNEISDFRMGSPCKVRSSMKIKLDTLLKPDNLGAIWDANK